MDLYQYRVVSVDKVVDGDTVDVTLDLGFKLYHKVRVRLSDYDAPETYRPKSSVEFEAGTKVKNFLKDLMFKVGSQFYLKSVKEEIYNRWGGYFVDQNGVVVNDQVIIYMKENKLTKGDLGLV